MARSPALDAPRVADLLEAGIASGAFHPNERLVEEHLAVKFGTNRTIVRMALQRLEQQGLIVRQRNHGARVRVISEPEALQLVEAKAALEAVMVRHAAQRATGADANRLRELLAQMRAACDAGDYQSYGRLDSMMHRTFTEIADHAVGARILEQLDLQVFRMQYRVLAMPGRVRASFLEHVPIVDAIAANDPQTAEASYRRHAENAAAALEELIASAHTAG